MAHNIAVSTIGNYIEKHFVFYGYVSFTIDHYYKSVVIFLEDIGGADEALNLMIADLAKSPIASALFEYVFELKQVVAT